MRQYDEELQIRVDELAVIKEKEQLDERLTVEKQKADYTCWDRYRSRERCNYE